MKIFRNNIFNTAVYLFFLCLSGPFANAGSGLAQLSKDPTVTVGKLPNGMACYFDVNKSGDGMISLSLVQRYSLLVPREQLVEQSRRHFTDAGFGSTGIEGILARNNVHPGPDGYIIAREGSVEYRFSGISTARADVALDSLLFSVFRIARMAAECGTPSKDQAVIVAGDFDRAALSTKMNLLSLMVADVQGETIQPEYQWKPEKYKDGIRSSGGRPARISLKWHGARLPDSYLGTVLPLVSRKMNGEFGHILKGRLYPVLRSDGIDARIQYEYQGSTDVSTDECSKLTVLCEEKDTAKIRPIVQRELDRLATYGVDDIEYAYARDSYMFAWQRKVAAADPSDTECVAKCKAAFLYGSTLASDADQMRFLYRNVPDTTQARLFNEWMIPKLLQYNKIDRTLSPIPPMLARADIASRVRCYCDTSVPFKAPKDAVEYVSGGQICTFPNGVNFAYKKLDNCGGMIYYAYAAKGGREWAVRDNLLQIEGVDMQEWANYLGSMGITMGVTMDVTNVILRGKAPKKHLDDLLAAIVAITKQEANRKVFDASCYKLLTLVGDIEYPSLKKKLCSYMPAFGYGSPWKSAEAYHQDSRHRELPDDVIAKHLTLSLDLSTENYALSEVCRYVLSEAMAREFEGCALSYVQEQSFAGFPTWSFNITYGVKRCALDGFALTEQYLDEAEIRRRLNNILKTLATTEIPQSQLQVCRQMACNAYASYSKTPEYYLRVICQRYLDNRNIYARYTSAVARVSSSAVREFFNSTQ